MYSAVSDGCRATCSSSDSYTPRSTSESCTAKRYMVAVRAISGAECIPRNRFGPAPLLEGREVASSGNSLRRALTFAPTQPPPSPRVGENIASGGAPASCRLARRHLAAEIEGARMAHGQPPGKWRSDSSEEIGCVDL